MQEHRCLLCGARLKADAFLDACTEVLDARLGVLEAICPYCQGVFEIRPATERLDLGFRNGDEFQVAQSLSFEGLTLERSENPAGLRLMSPARTWSFSASD